MTLGITEIPMRALDGLALLDGTPFQSSAAWWRAATATALPPGANPRFLLVRDAQRPILLLPIMQARRTRSLTTPYTSLFQPPAAPDADLAAAGAALARHLGPVTHIEAIDPGWPGWGSLASGLRQAGHRVAGFDHVANWRERLAGRDWRGYLADRPGALREIIRRRLGQAERDPDITVSLATTPDAAMRHLADYQRVHAASWKPAEPHPDFLPALVAAAAAAGVLRLAVLRRTGAPLAAQIWTVQNHTAIVMKLAHDETAAWRSPGTILTAWMIRRLIEEDQVTTLDFGRGDDSYKRLWATERHQRGGLVIADPRHPAGAAALLRQAASTALRRIPLCAALRRGILSNALRRRILDTASRHKILDTASRRSRG